MKSAFVSLGAGSFQVPLIEAARDAGFHVIAVDRNASAPGFAAADECIQQSITRPAHLRRRLAGGANPICALASRSFGRALISGAALSDALGVEGPDLRAGEILSGQAALQGGPGPGRNPDSSRHTIVQQRPAKPASSMQEASWCDRRGAQASWACRCFTQRARKSS
jgi:hypothetical protein